jgi:hypothetical protein
MVRALRAGHAVVRACGIDPDSLDPSVWRRAVAPRTARDSWLAQLVFLAPDIQQAMLLGEVKPGNHPDWRKIPLSWTAQRTMFLAETASAPSRSTS